jgi:hypothetical protein
MDIVSYTKFDVEEQMAVRKHYYALVDDILGNYCNDDYITLDAGDGMAVCYTGDPEDVLIMAINLRDEFIALQQSDDNIKYKVRLGINLGPVKIVELQGEKRVIGDAINVANRVMSFAGDNQLLVSRSYFDVVSNVSKEYMNMFKYLGVHEDKHVRKHAVYEVSPGEGDNIDDETEQAAMAETESVTDFGEDTLHSIATALASHVGPMARILVKKSARKAKDLEDLYQMLAQDIPDDTQRAKFLQSRHRLH